VREAEECGHDNQWVPTLLCRDCGHV
jgi:hypothetical protein